MSDEPRKIILRQRHLGVEEVIAAIYKFRGNLTRMAEYLGVRRTVLRGYINRHTRLLEAMKDVDQSVCDQVEGNLYDMAVDEKDPWAMALVLHAKGADRGYSKNSSGAGSAGSDALSVTHVYIDGIPSGEFAKVGLLSVDISPIEPAAEDEGDLIVDDGGSPIIEGTANRTPEEDTEAMRELRRQLGK